MSSAGFTSFTNLGQLLTGTPTFSSSDLSAELFARGKLAQLQGKIIRIHRDNTLTVRTEYGNLHISLSSDHQKKTDQPHTQPYKVGQSVEIKIDSSLPPSSKTDIQLTLRPISAAPNAFSQDIDIQRSESTPIDIKLSDIQKPQSKRLASKVHDINISHRAFLSQTPFEAFSISSISESQAQSLIEHGLLNIPQALKSRLYAVENSLSFILTQDHTATDATLPVSPASQQLAIPATIESASLSGAPHFSSEPFVVSTPVTQQQLLQAPIATTTLSSPTSLPNPATGPYTLQPPLQLSLLPVLDTAQAFSTGPDAPPPVLQSRENTIVFPVLSSGVFYNNAQSVSFTTPALQTDNISAPPHLSDTLLAITEHHIAESLPLSFSTLPIADGVTQAGDLPTQTIAVLRNHTLIVQRSPTDPQTPAETLAIHISPPSQADPTLWDHFNGTLTFGTALPLPGGIGTTTRIESITFDTFIQQETVRLSSVSSLPSAPPLTMSLTNIDTPQFWPVMNEIYQSLWSTGAISSSTQHSNVFAQTLPNPANSNQFAAATLFFVAALRGGDVESWLGEKAIKALRDLGKHNLLSRLSQDMSTVSRTASDPLPQDWRSLSLPLFWDGDVKVLSLHYKSGSSTDDDTQNNDGGSHTRFVFDLTLDEMGPIQLDGYYHPHTGAGARLDVILRSEQAFCEGMKAEMRRLYMDAMKSTQISGELGFQKGKNHWVTVQKNDDSALGVDA